jgi:putative ABC transport system permease protein
MSLLSYYLGLAFRSLKRTPVITALMVIAIGLGIGASMTMITVLHVMSGDPMPGRSGTLFYPHLDPLPRDYPEEDGGPADDFTWPDALALLQQAPAVHQAAMSGGSVLVRPARKDLQPFYADGRYTTPDFFSMFGLSFLEGGGWSAADEAAHARVVVLSHSFADKLFGAVPAVGRTLRFGDTDFRVIGVTPDWQPSPKFYSGDSYSMFSGPDGFFVPLHTAQELKFGVDGNTDCWGKARMDSMYSDPTCTWLQFWVELDTPAQVAAYSQFLHDYSAEQAKAGRFQRPPSNARLDGLMPWLRAKRLVPDDVQLQLWLALGFLAVCLTNIVCLLLAKFLRRRNEISVRRALGASRRDIFLQFSVEAALIGVAGGLLGLALAQAGLWAVRQRPDSYAHLARMDLPLLLWTLSLAVSATLLAGIVPAWRASGEPPAALLKSE